MTITVRAKYYMLWQSLRAVKRRATLAFPTFRFIICILNTQMALFVFAGGGNLNGLTWNAPITLVFAIWWS